MAQAQLVLYDDLTEVHDRIRACTACEWGGKRTCAVVGEGPEDAKIVFVGEAPGYTEDQTGRPFIGAAGKQLDEMLDEAKINREDVFVLNAVRCRPTKVSGHGNVVNATPNVKQIRACQPHLLAEIACLDPRVIVLLGNTPLAAVLGTQYKVTKIRGDVQQVEFLTASGTRQVKVIATFHPASVLYSAANRPLIIRDLKRAKQESKTRGFTAAPATDVRIVRTLPELTELVDQMLRADIVAFDTETAASGLHRHGQEKRALDPRQNILLCCSFAWVEGQAWVVPLRDQLIHDRVLVEKSVDTEVVDRKTKELVIRKRKREVEVSVPRMDMETGDFDERDLPWVWTEEERPLVLAELRRFFASPVPKCGQHAKFDFKVVRKHLGVDVENLTDDTLLAHALVHEDQAHSLEHFRTVYTNVPYYEGWKTDRSILPTTHSAYCLVPTDLLWPYAGTDADVTIRSLHALHRELDQEGESAWAIYDSISVPLCLALREMEDNGVKVDVGRLMRVQGEYQGWIDQAERDLHEAAGYHVNYASNRGIQRLLFDHLGFTPEKYTPGGEPAVDAKVVEKLLVASDHPALAALVRVKAMIRQRDSYLAGKDGNGGLLRWLDETGYIHTTFNQTPRTGRLSSSDPNLHNVTKSKDEAEKFAGSSDDAADLAIRSIFDAPDGYVLGEWDYSQLELRLQAYICQEPLLLDGFAHGAIDQHTITAAGIFDVPQDKVTVAQRTDAKRMNFALGYGGGVAAIIRVTGWDHERAQVRVDKYRETYYMTEKMRKRVARWMYRDGYVDNAFGRRRHFPTYRQAKDASRRPGDEGKRAWKDAAEMERQGYNFYAGQSPGSDCLSLSTIELRPLLKKMGVIPCLTLHDAYYAYVPHAIIDEVDGVVRDVMENVAKRRGLDWTLPVDGAWGPRWSEHTGGRKGVVAHG